MIQCGSEHRFKRFTETIRFKRTSGSQIVDIIMKLLKMEAVNITCSTDKFRDNCETETSIRALGNQ